MKDIKKLPAWAVVLINLGAMVIVSVIILILLFRWMGSYTRHGESISVPDVTGLTQEEASAIFLQNGLRCEVNDVRYEASMAEGGIIEQRPAAGSSVKAGRIVYLTVNSGRVPTRKIPDVADNSSLRDAESKLLGAGFKLTEPEYIPGEKDWVYEVRYKGRVLKSWEEIPEGSLLTIAVGNGEDKLEEFADSLTDTGIDSAFFAD